MQSDPSAVTILAGVGERTIATRSGLAVDATTDPASPVLAEFYAGYDAAFVLPNEKEELAGFVACLALNAGDAYARLSGHYGPYCEVVLVARESEGGAPVGGANFIAFPLHAGGDTLLSLNLNYLYVDARQRRRGHFRRLLAAVGEAAAAFFDDGAGQLDRLIFIEQNDPLQMHADDYARDTAHAGIDQMQRIRLWAGAGARIVDFAYVQPPLSAAQAPDTTLIYAVLGAPGDALDACLLREHLVRFFGISVLKGSNPLQDAAAAPQLARLAELCRSGATVPLLRATDLPERQDCAPYAALRDAIRART